MKPEKQYQLAFLFEPEDGDLQELEKKIRRALVKHLQAPQSVKLKFETIFTGRLKVEIQGGKCAVDACHGKLDAEVCNSTTKFIRLVDQVSDEYRRKAYPLLSELEQELRNFIQEAMVEMRGLSWWEELDPESQIGNRIAEIQAKSGKHGLQHHHPLEFSEFQHLVEIITGPLPSWREDKSLTVADFQDLLSKSATIDELKSELEKRVEKKSFWDTFRQFFDNEEEWTIAAKSLTGWVIPLRNKVMHHRPIRQYEFDRLQKEIEIVRKALKAKRRVLKPEERAELQNKTQDLSQSLRHELEQIRSFHDILQRQRQDLAKVFSLPAQALHEMQKALRIKETQMMEEALRPIRDMQKMSEEVLRSIRDAQEVPKALFEPFTKKKK